MKGVLRKALDGHALNDSIQPGKQALEHEHRLAVHATSSTITDSLHFDRAVAAIAPSDPKFDYLIGVRGSTDAVEAVEVHRATADRIKELIAKKAWTERYLAKIPLPVARWHWVATNRIGFRRGSNEERRLIAARSGSPSSGSRCEDAWRGDSMIRKMLFGCLMLGMTAAAGCGSDSSFTCSTGGACRAGRTFESCCSATQCEYRADGMTFRCDGTNCSSAASRVVAYCSGS